MDADDLNEVMTKPEGKQSSTSNVGVRVLGLLIGGAFFVFIGLPFALHWATHIGNAAKVREIKCANNLKSVTEAFRGFANDNDERFPAGTPDGFAPWAQDAFSAHKHFAALSNRLITPKIVVCPEDPKYKTLVTNFADIKSNVDVGYFVGLFPNAGLNKGVLLGDQNLTNNLPVINGFLSVRSNNPVGWSRLMHKRGDNLAFVDGSVTRQVTIRQEQFGHPLIWPEQIALPVAPINSG